jgi:hypothetical protein
VTRGTSYASVGRDPFGSYIATDVCIHNLEDIYNCEIVPEEAHYCMMWVLQLYGLVLVNVCSLEFYHLKTFSFYDESEGD